MQDLPHSFHQKDKILYQALTTEGSERYEKLYMSGKASPDEDGAAMGIPADDFNIFATMVYAFAAHSEDLETIRTSMKAVRHIDVGTGPSLYPFIASLPYADELVSIDLSPANVERLEADADKATPLAVHWQAWLEIAAILYSIGSAQKLLEIDKNYPHLYDSLRHWPNLDDEKRNAVRETLRTLSDKSKLATNPYDNIDLQVELAAKLQPRLGDVLDGTGTLADLVGTADIYTKVFFSESIDNNAGVVAHAETNGIQFAKTGAIVISGHMTKTDGYKGFFTPEELAKNPDRKLVEFPASSRFFEELLGKIVALSDTYRALWEEIESISEDRKMVRQNLSYGGAVILYGTANHKDSHGHNKYENGLALLSAIEPEIRTVTVCLGPNQQVTATMNCAVSELKNTIDEMIDLYVLTNPNNVSIMVANFSSQNLFQV